MIKVDKPLTIRFSSEQVQKIDELIAKGLFEKRSAVIRKAVAMYLINTNA